MKRITTILLLIVSIFTSVQAFAQKNKHSEPIHLGAEINNNDDKKDGRNLSEHLIIPKGEWQLGMQISHVSLSSANSEYILLLKNFDANGAITKIAPFFAYSYHDNRSIGLKLQYATASGNIEQGDLDFLSDDLNFHIEDISAGMTSYQSAIYHRSYIGLDNKGRIGLFGDVMLGYTSSKTNFIYNETTANAYAKSNQLKLSLHPGIVVFAMNNISTHVSMGIGGVSYNKTKYIKDGEVIGIREFSKANFKIDVLDISIGLSIHL